jgi:hypothetical protein
VTIIHNTKVETGVAGVPPFLQSRYYKGGLEKSGVSRWQVFQWDVHTELSKIYITSVELEMNRGKKKYTQSVKGVQKDNQLLLLS